MFFKRFYRITCEHKESHYQKIAQHKYGYGHKRLPSGITDITTKDRHIEIKKWNKWSHALGQILSYDYYDNKPILEAHFFGEYSLEKKQIAIEVFKKYNIRVVDISE